MDKEIKEALNRLQDVILRYKSALVCYSGGTDSFLVLKVAADVLGRENVSAFLGVSPSIPKREIEDAEKFAKKIGVKILKQKTLEFLNPNYLKNDENRCFYCKYELCKTAKELKEKVGFDVVFDGTNFDDSGDFRPGTRALKIFSVFSPLKEAGIGKQMVRDILRYYGFEIAYKPSFACLSSRVVYNLKINEELLRKIEQIEDFLRLHGFKNYRARVHKNSLLRIEVEEKDIKKFFDDNLRREVLNLALNLGFSYVTLDLEGFVSGKMNRSIKRL